MQHPAAIDVNVIEGRIAGLDVVLLVLGGGEADVTPVFKFCRQVARPTAHEDVVSPLHATIQVVIHLSGQVDIPCHCEDQTTTENDE